MRKFTILLLLLYLTGFANVAGQEYRRITNYQTLSEVEIDTLLSKTIKNALSNPDSALTQLGRLERHCQRINYYKGQATALFFIAAVYLEIKRDAITSIKFHRESYSVYRKVKNQDIGWKINWYSNMGTSFLAKGDRDSAMFYLGEVPNLYLSSHRQPETALMAVNNLGTLFLEVNQYAKARYYLELAEEIGIKEGSKIQLITTYQHIAGSYANEKKFDSALFYLKKVEQLGVQLPLVESERQHMIAGMVYYHLGRFEASIREVKSALIIAPSSKIKALHLNNIGTAFMAIQDYEQAQIYLIQSLNQAQKDNLKERYKDVIISIYDNLANLYDSLKDYRQAYHFRTLYAILVDTTHKVENNEVINRLETQYRSAEKDKQIAESQVRLLAANQQTRNRTTWMITIGGVALLMSLMFITLIQRQRLKLQKARTREEKLKVSSLRSVIEGEEKERSRIGRQLHDEVMVEFSIVRMNMAALPQQHHFVKQIPDYQELSRQLDVACLKLRQAAHNLMPDALMEEGLLSAIQYFCTNVQDSSGLRINFQHYGELPELPVDKAVSMYRIVQELVQNVIKHAKASRILVQLSYRNGQLDLTVEDDGRGMGNRDQAGDGMGLKSIRMRLRALGGNMEIHPVKPQGTSVQIEVDARDVERG